MTTSYLIGRVLQALWLMLQAFTNVTHKGLLSNVTWTHKDIGSNVTQDHILNLLPCVRLRQVKNVYSIFYGSAAHSREIFFPGRDLEIKKGGLSPPPTLSGSTWLPPCRDRLGHYLRRS